jgi:hypothetical protein
VLISVAGNIRPQWWAILRFHCSGWLGIIRWPEKQNSALCTTQSLELTKLVPVGLRTVLFIKIRLVRTLSAINISSYGLCDRFEIWVSSTKGIVPTHPFLSKWQSFDNILAVSTYVCLYSNAASSGLEECQRGSCRGSCYTVFREILRIQQETLLRSWIYHAWNKNVGFEVLMVVTVRSTIF